MTEHVVSIQSLCDEVGIRRLSAEEMVELVEDGEEIAWLVEQVLPEGPREVADSLSGLLAQVPVAVKPDLPASSDDIAPEAGGAAPVKSEEGDSHATLPLQGFDAKALEGLELPKGFDASQLEQVLSSPQGAMLADFGTFCEERGLTFDKAKSVSQAGLEEGMKEIHDEWLHTPREALDGKRPGDVLGSRGLFPEKVQTYRREAPKVGRNDPCSCGSGRKYKKCCGKGE